MAHRAPQPIQLSLFTLLKHELGETLPIANCTKATLVYLSHALEDLVLTRKLSGLIFTGFQESSHWREETQRYQALVEIAHQVCIFAGKPLPPESEAHELHIELADDDPMRQEWFLAILTHRFAVVLCGQDNLKSDVSESEREFETLWTFEPRVIDQILDVLENVVGRYRPEKLAQLQEARALYPPPQPDAEIVTHFTLDLVNYQESLHMKLLKAEREQKTINQALAASEERFRDVVDSVIHHIFAKILWDDGTQETLYIAPNIEQYLGYPPHLFENDPYFWVSLIHPEDLPIRNAHVERLLKGESAVAEYRMRHKDGYYIRMRIHARLKRNPGADYMTVYAVVEDITKEYEAAQALERMKERFRLVIDSINHSFYISHIDNQGVFSNVYIAPNLEGLIGYSIEYFEEDWNFWLSLIHPEDLLATLEQEERLRRGEDSIVEYRMRRVDGVWIRTRDSAKVLTDPATGGKIVYGIHTDITEERATEQALAFSKERFEQVIASISHTIYVTQITPEGVFKNLYLSPNVEQMTGHQAYLFEQDSELWSSLVHPEDRPRDQVLKTNILQGRNIAIEYRVQSVKNQWIWVRNSARLRSDSVTGNLVVYGVLEDVTERYEFEKTLLKAEKMRVALEQAQELNVIRSQFMTTVSHEFRTPLATILSSAELLERYFDRMTPESRGQRLTTIQAQVQHLRELLDDISAVLNSQNNISTFNPIAVDVYELLEALMLTMRKKFQSSHQITFNFKGRSDPAEIDPDQVETIVENLISNAIKYSPMQSEVRCDVTMYEQEIIIHVSDHGIGIPPEDREHLFQPFFRGSNIGAIGGTGLGLKIVENSVILAGGTITYTSEVNQGTTFTVRLPTRRKYG